MNTRGFLDDGRNVISKFLDAFVEGLNKCTKVCASQMHHLIAEAWRLAMLATFAHEILHQALNQRRRLCSGFANALVSTA